MLDMVPPQIWMALAGAAATVGGMYGFKFIFKVFGTGVVEVADETLTKSVRKDLLALETKLDKGILAIQTSLTYLADNGLATRQNIAQNTADISSVREFMHKEFAAIWNRVDAIQAWTTAAPSARDYTQQDP